MGIVDVYIITFGYHYHYISYHIIAPVLWELSIHHDHDDDGGNDDLYDNFVVKLTIMTLLTTTLD